MSVMTVHRPGTFKLPSLKLRKKGAQAGRMSQITAQAASSIVRVRNATPTLKALYEFLARPLP